MRLDEFDYELPSDLIAQSPAEARDQSRLMVLPPGEGLEHRTFADLPEILRPDDLLVLNDTRVLAARVQALRATGGAVELLFIAPDDAASTPLRPAWRAMARPAKRVRVGEYLTVRDDRLEVLAARPDGSRILGFPAGTDVPAWLEEHGEMPLPPYIHPEDAAARRELDRDRYQTVYAAEPGAVAAPTAGLHFTPALLDRLRARGVETAFLTLNVGPGTFRPVTTDKVEDHTMDGEVYRISETVAEQVNAARAAGRRVVAVGTTSVRALEHAASLRRETMLVATRAVADILITPGYRFRIVDAMITNLHLPRSTPILMAAAMVGRERLLDAYAAAVQERYRFYSYGDAMLLQ